MKMTKWIRVMLALFCLMGTTHAESAVRASAKVQGAMQRLNLSDLSTVKTAVDAFQGVWKEVHDTEEHAKEIVGDFKTFFSDIITHYNSALETYAEPAVLLAKTMYSNDPNHYASGIYDVVAETVTKHWAPSLHVLGGYIVDNAPNPSASSVEALGKKVNAVDTHQAQTDLVTYLKKSLAPSTQTWQVRVANDWGTVVYQVTGLRRVRTQILEYTVDPDASHPVLQKSKSLQDSSAYSVITSDVNNKNMNNGNPTGNLAWTAGLGASGNKVGKYNEAVKSKSNPGISDPYTLFYLKSDNPDIVPSSDGKTVKVTMVHTQDRVAEFKYARQVWRGSKYWALANFVGIDDPTKLPGSLQSASQSNLKTAWSTSFDYKGKAGLNKDNPTVYVNCSQRGGWAGPTLWLTNPPLSPANVGNNYKPGTDVMLPSKAGSTNQASAWNTNNSTISK